MTATGPPSATRDGAQRLAHEHVAHVRRDLGRRGAEHDGLVGVDRDEHRGHGGRQVALDVDDVRLARPARRAMASLACLMAAGDRRR